MVDRICRLPGKAITSCRLGTTELVAGVSPMIAIWQRRTAEFGAYTRCTDCCSQDVSFGDLPRRLEFTYKTATAVGVMPYCSALALACQGIRQVLEELGEVESLMPSSGDWPYRVYSIRHYEIGRKVYEAHNRQV